MGKKKGMGKMGMGMGMSMGMGMGMSSMGMSPAPAMSMMSMSPSMGPSMSPGMSPSMSPSMSMGMSSSMSMGMASTMGGGKKMVMAKRTAAKAYARMGASADKIQMKTGVNTMMASKYASKFGKGDYMDKKVKDKQPGVGHFKIQERKDPQRGKDRKAIDRLKKLQSGMGMGMMSIAETIGGNMGMGSGMGMGMAVGNEYRQKLKDGDFGGGTGQDFSYDDIEVPVLTMPEFGTEFPELLPEEEIWDDEIWWDDMMMPMEEAYEMPDPTTSVGSDAGLSATGVVLGGRRRARTAGTYQFNRDYVPQRDLNLSNLGINV